MELFDEKFGQFTKECKKEYLFVENNFSCCRSCGYNKMLSKLSQMPKYLGFAFCSAYEHEEIKVKDNKITVYLGWGLGQSILQKPISEEDQIRHVGKLFTECAERVGIKIIFTDISKALLCIVSSD